MKRELDIPVLEKNQFLAHFKLGYTTMYLFVYKKPYENIIRWNGVKR
jgi:hypothetical protein